MEARRGARGVWRRASDKYPRLTIVRERVARFIASTFKRVGDVKPENIVWIFGTGRTGSTWLSAMMGEIEGHAVWFEPRVGDVFDSDRIVHHGEKHFIFESAHKETWLGSIRAFVLNGANARFPEVRSAEEYLVIKEPGGSAGAPLLMEALPESRMILLVRDPRDVVASWLDALKKGGWRNEQRKEEGQERASLAESDPNAFVEKNAHAYLREVGNAKRAYDAHEGHKVLVRYEDLLADAWGAVRGIYAVLEITVDEDELARAVRKHSWERIPEEKKGAGKFYRKATPGGWKEDLTPEQIEIIERMTAPLLEELYPDRSGGARTRLPDHP